VLAAHVVVMLATYAAIYWIVRAVSDDVRACAIIAAASALTMGRTLGGNYLLAGYSSPRRSRRSLGGRDGRAGARPLAGVRGRSRARG